jgi:hypothetical protein
MAMASIPDDSRFQDLRGQTFGRLTVKEYLGKRKTAHTWLCVCECGGTSQSSGGSLKKGNTRSCGCLKLERISETHRVHGHCGKGSSENTPEYICWINMKGRCYNKNDDRFNAYGQRGITVCDRWLSGENGLSGFQCFIADIGLRPSKGHSLDRINNDGNYEPSNCHWTTNHAQNRNKTTNRYVIYQGERMIIKDAIRASGLTMSYFYYWMAKGLSFDEVLNKPR